MRFSFHSPLYAFPSLRSVFRTVGKEKCGALMHYKIQINGAKCTFIYIYKGTEREDPNFASFLVPFSSFCKKRNRYSFLPFL